MTSSFSDNVLSYQYKNKMKINKINTDCSVINMTLYVKLLENHIITMKMVSAGIKD